MVCASCRPRLDEGVLEERTWQLTPEDPLCVSWLAYRAGHTQGAPERLIYSLKHRDDRRIFDFVTDAFSPRVKEVLNACGVLPDETVWVFPPRRLKAVLDDGFDQAQRLAQGLAKACGGVCYPLIERKPKRHVKAQKKLNAEERRQNAIDVYDLPVEAIPYVQGKTMILVDDVCTTGATLRACTRLLEEAGAAEVIWVTVAKA